MRAERSPGASRIRRASGRLLAAALVLAAAPAASGCGPKCEPLYLGDATDEAWRTMIDDYDQAEIGTMCAPEITIPLEGEMLVAPAPMEEPRIDWTASCLALGPVPHDRTPAAGLAPARVARTLRCGGAGGTDVLDAIHDLLVPDAAAHLPPVTGEIYYLEVPVGGNCDVLWLTTDTFVAVDAETLALLRAAPQPLSLTITGAYLTDNRVTEGPYRPAAPRTFTVE